MELTVTRRDTTTYTVTVQGGELKQELMNADSVTLKVISSTPIEFRIDDQATLLGRRYRINRLPQATKTADNRYSYTVEMEGEMYNLLRAQFLLFDDTGLAIEGDFSYMATLEDLVRLLVKNLNRVYGTNAYYVGTFPVTEAKNHTFSSENCLAVLQRICAEYEQEFDLIYAAGATTINIGEVGSVKSFSLKYGAGLGLYELTRTAINDKNVFTRLFAYGSDRNLKGDYRGFSRRLKLPLNDESYIEDAAAIAAMGIIEHTKIFEDVYPHRTGIVSTVGDTATFSDSGMDFDLNATTGGNTLYLIAGNPAKVHFNTGNLAGYEFEILSYNHTAKTFVLKKYKDERGMEFPSAGAFAIQPGDEYVLLDITMPQSYIDAAEAELQAKATALLNQGKVVKAKYACKIDPIYAKTEGLSLQVGDYVPVVDSGLNINRNFRVISLTRDIIEPYKWVVDLGDEVEVSYITQLFQDRIETNKIVKLNRLKDPAIYRNSWKTTKELQSMIFDQEDYFDTTNIKPLSIETSMLSVGSKAGQFVLNGVVFQPSFNAVANRIASTAGTLSHYAIEDNIRTWNISAYDVTLSDNNARYIYAKCAIATNLGEVRYSTSQLKVDAEAGYYHFLIGVLHSVLDGYRKTSLTYGSTTINGKEIKTGRITSQDGQTYFDLDTGQIAGKISFSSGSSGYSNLTDKPDLSVYSLQDDVDALTANLQAQIDGQIMTYFYDYVPTLANAPANGWATTEDKDKHLGDLFYNSATGIGYRFSKIGSVYSWEVLKDTDVATALANAAAAQDTADAKRRVFLAQPTTPYEAGDLWTQGTSGDLMRCKTTRLTGSYTAADWEKAVKYTDDTALNNLEIGGRNLFPRTDFAELVTSKYYPSGQPSIYTLSVDNGALKIVGTNSGNGDDALKRITAVQLGVNTDELQTISFEAYANVPVILSFRPHYGTLTTNGGAVAIGTALTKHKVTFLNKYYYSEGIQGVGFFLWLSSAATIYISKLKLEKGNKATDWTPAPEDVQAGIDAASTAAANAQSTADTAAGSVSSLNTYVDGAFRDGVIETSEAKAIEKYINSVTESWTDFESTYNVLYLNSYLEGTPKTNLLNAKVSLAGTKTNLLNSINTAIADGKTTAAEKADVDSKFTSFNSAVASFKTAVENANKAIQAKLDTLSEGYANTAAAAAAAAQSTANDAAAAANTANNNIADITNDNKFTPDEKSSVRREWEVIAAEKTVNDAQADAFSVSKTAYGTSFQDLADYLNEGPWIAGIPKRINDENLGVTTSILGSSFRYYFTEYYESRTALLNSIAIKAKQLADAAQDSVDNLEIGGRNLLSKSSGTEIGNATLGGVYALGQYACTIQDNSFKITSPFVGGVNNSDRVVFNILKDLKLNQPYTISFEAKTTSSLDRLHIVRAWYQGSQNVIIETGDWKKYSISFILTDENTNTTYFNFWQADQNIYITYLRNIKIEFGNKPTDWTPAPEDVQAEIDAYSYLKEAMQNATDIQGGLLSTTLIKLGAVNQSGSWVEKAGINGAGTSDSTPRLYAGGTLQQAINRVAGMLTNVAKFVVTEGGKIFGMEVELFGSFSTAPPGGKRIHISHEAGAVNIHDDNGDVKTTITSEAIPTLASLLSPNSSSVDASKAISLTKTNGDETSTQYTAVLTLPSTSSNFTITTPPIEAAISAGIFGEKQIAYATVVAYLVKPDSTEIEIGSMGAYASELDPSDVQNGSIPSKCFEGMPAGDYKIKLTASVNASEQATAYASIEIASPNNTLAGVAVVDISRIMRDGMFIIRDANNYAYLNPMGVVEKYQNAPDRPGVLLSGRGISTGGSAALWGAKKHATLTVSKVTTGTYTVYHSIGHTNYSVQVTPMDASRSARWTNPQTDRFTIYTYSGASLADTNFSFATFGDN